MDRREIDQFMAMVNTFDVQSEVRYELQKLTGAKPLPFASFEMLLFTVKAILSIAPCRETRKEFIEKFHVAESISDLIYRERRSEKLDCDSVYKSTIEILADKSDYFSKNIRFQNIYQCDHLVAGVYNAYRNKNLYLHLLTVLCCLENVQIAYYVILYINQVRQYYIDERASVSSAIDLIQRLCNEANPSRAREIIQEKTIEDKKNAGIYEVSRADFEAMEAQAQKIRGELDETSSMMESIYTAVKSQQELMQSIESDIDKARLSMEQQAQEFIETTDNKLNDIIAASQNAIRDIMRQKKEITDELNTQFNKFKLDVNRVAASSGLNGTGTRAPVPFVLQSEVRADGGSYEHPKNPLFEGQLNEWEKVQQFVAGKSPDELYHERFDALGKILLMDRPTRAVLLVGPSGAGKSHTVEQLSRVLNLKLYSMGYVNEEYKLIGFKDANSNYDITPFYIAFKYGGLCFFDEIDNSHPGALMLLHEFMGTSNGASYMFPNKEEVKAHPYFRLIAAANTWGDGANRTYNVRAKLDGATENRFKAIKYDYDPRVEEKLTKDKELLSFLRAYRTALTDNDYPQPLTYRDIMDMNEFIHGGRFGGLFTVDEAMEINLIKGSNQAKLQKIAGSISSGGLDQSNPYFAAFNKLINQMG